MITSWNELLVSSFWWEVKLPLHVEEESRLSEAVRNAVLERDDWICAHCGESDVDKLTVHHVMFRSQGGGHHMANLVTLCGRCHGRIHHHTLEVMNYEGTWYFRNVNLR